MKLPPDMSIQNARVLIEYFHRLFLQQKMKALRVEFSGVVSFDSAGALALVELERNAKEHNVTLSLEGMSSQVRGLLSLIPQDLATKSSLIAPKRHPGVFEKVGDAAITVFYDSVFMVKFVGDICIGLFQACLHPGRVRWGDTITYMMRCGVDAVPIVLLISFLIGLIMGFQAAIQLRQFGANIFVADLVGLAQVRELGPLMTAIIVAGRSGSAFAAQIGTMKVSEEVDALSAMGLDTTRFLVVPKILALLLTLPTLALLSDAVGILGGMVVGVGSLDLTVVQYINETTKAMVLFDVFSGYLKSFVFAFLIAAVGCMRGLQVKGGAEGVGLATTSSVVSGIFLIILTDAIFTILFSYF